MRINLSRVAAAGFLMALCVLGAVAQRETIAAAAGDKYVISAKAGGVNFVEGAVSVSRKNGRSGLLLKGDQIQIDDVVSTGTDGRAEVLLNPGSYVRLGSSTNFEFDTTSLDDLQLSIGKGSAIFEVFADDDFRIAVNTPKGLVYLIQSGIYRVDVTGDQARIEVWKGRAQLGESTEATVKSGREAIIGSGVSTVSKFDRDDKDSFEVWSKSRAKDLAKISTKLKRDTMRTSLMQSFLGRRWNVYDSFGLWAYDPWSSSYCFVPFGYGWSSPYGFGFGPHIGWYNLPPVIYYPQPNNPNGPSTGGVLTTKPGRARGEAPAFVRMQDSGAAGTKRRVNPTRANDDGFGGGRSPAPVFSAPAPSVPIMTSKPGINRRQ